MVSRADSQQNNSRMVVLGIGLASAALVLGLGYYTARQLASGRRGKDPQQAATAAGGTSTLQPEALLAALRAQGLDKIKMRQNDNQKLDQDYFLKLLNFIGVSVKSIWATSQATFVRKRRALDKSAADYEEKYSDLAKQRVITMD